MRIEECLEKAGILPGDYEGLTTIDFLISPRASELDMETMSLIYEARTTRGKEKEMPRLPPEVEKFLRELDRRFREG